MVIKKNSIYMKTYHIDRTITWYRSFNFYGENRLDAMTHMIQSKDLMTGYLNYEYPITISFSMFLDLFFKADLQEVAWNSKTKTVFKGYITGATFIEDPST